MVLALTLLKSPPGFEKLSPTLSIGGNHISGKPAAHAGITHKATHALCSSWEKLTSTYHLLWCGVELKRISSEKGKMITLLALSSESLKGFDALLTPH